MVSVAGSSIEIRAVPVAMTQAMIDEIVAAYAAAAGRCEEGGLDGVEVHAAHGYLLSQFLSPLTNLREDDYGGPLQDRARIVREVLAAIRAAVRPTFAVGVRLSSSELVDGGLTVVDTAEIAVALAAAGLVDFVNFSIGSFYVGHTIVAPMHEPHGYQVPYAAQISGRLDVPTIVAGRIMNLAEAEQILADGAADLVSMVRATIADPDLVNKTIDGREAVRPCIGANQGCVGGMYGPRHRLGCDVNVDVGREHRAEPISPATAARRVLVAGAGPAGLEAARIAALRGHDVVVHESDSTVGGATVLARRAPFSTTAGSASGRRASSAVSASSSIRNRASTLCSCASSRPTSSSSPPEERRDETDSSSTIPTRSSRVPSWSTCSPSSTFSATG